MSQPPQKVRKTPKFIAFLLTGGLLGLIAGFLLAMFGPGDAGYEGSSALGFLGLIGAGFGMLAGGLVAVLLDRRA